MRIEEAKHASIAPAKVFLLNQDIRQADGCDYLPTDILTAVMGLSFQQDSQGLILTVSFPAPAEG